MDFPGSGIHLFLGGFGGPGAVPGTEERICTWYKRLDMYLVQIGLRVPGTIPVSCAWHKHGHLFLAQNRLSVPGTRPQEIGHEGNP
jgi:hypothetical protein